MSSVWKRYHGLKSILMVPTEEYGAELLFASFTDTTLNSQTALETKFKADWESFVYWSPYVQFNYRGFAALGDASLPPQIIITLAFQNLAPQQSRTTTADVIQPIEQQLKTKFGARDAEILETVQGAPGEVTAYYKKGSHVIVPPQPSSATITLLKWTGAGVLIYGLHRILTILRPRGR